MHNKFKLPIYFWAKAMSIANYIQNRVPTSALIGIVIPKE
jgi:hypothetical protein